MDAGSSTESLLLGPMLRHVGETTATVWVQTASACRATVRMGEREWSARTFGVHGHHYAVVCITGLEAGSSEAYAVELDGEPVWPPAGAGYPPSRILTLDRRRPTRLAFGSCRTSVPHTREGNASHGVDAMRAFALHLADVPEELPDLMLFLGDQVYADETSDEMREFIASRRSLDVPPGEELKDYHEYAHLYRLAWSDPANRWLMSTVPSVMIFDDHDIRDDWNTSIDWRRKMEAKPWWHERIVGGLASYWVYQHVGNLSPKALSEDGIWQLIAAHQESDHDDEVDVTAPLEALVEGVDRDPEIYRWSYTIDLGDSRLVVVDSRAARQLDPDRRSMLDDDEMRWLDSQLQGGVQHLLIGTSLPFMMLPGLHDLEAIDEALAEGAWGRRPARVGEWLRQALDLEHWAAFQEGFAHVFQLVMEVACGERGPAPATVVFLSGDVHNSYVTQVPPEALPPGASAILQAVCSPIRNPLPRGVRIVTALMARGLARPLRFVARRSRKVPDPAHPWVVTHGPWFDNNLALLEVHGRTLTFRWNTGEVQDGRDDHPRLREVARVEIP
jgi:PhoD-like phosphatase